MAELLVVVVLLGIVVTLVYMLVNAATAMTNSISARAIAQQESQRAIDRMSTDIREAMENRLQYGAVVNAGANDLQMYVNATGNGRPQLIRYWASGGSLWRTVQLASNATTPTDLLAANPWTFGAASTPERIVQTLDTTHGDLFCYHDKITPATSSCPNGQDHELGVPDAGHLANPLQLYPAEKDPPESQVISLIGINLANTQTEGQTTATIVSDVLVRIRSINNDTN